jgi:hypothetical protein
MQPYRQKQEGQALIIASFHIINAYTGLWTLNVSRISDPSPLYPPHPCTVHSTLSVRYNCPGSYFYFLLRQKAGWDSYLYPRADSRRYGVGCLRNLFWMNNTVASLLYGYYLVITRTYTILDNTHVSKLQYFVQPWAKIPL